MTENNNDWPTFNYGINKAVHLCSSNIWHTAFIFTTALAVAFVGYYIYCSSQVFQPAIALPSNDEFFSSSSSSITKPFFCFALTNIVRGYYKTLHNINAHRHARKDLPYRGGSTGIAGLQCDDFLTCHTFILLADYFFIELWLEGAAGEGAKPRKKILPTGFAGM